jgi:hypothetical protein
MAIEVLSDLGLVNGLAELRPEESWKSKLSPVAESAVEWVLSGVSAALPARRLAHITRHRTRSRTYAPLPLAPYASPYADLLGCQTGAGQSAAPLEQSKEVYASLADSVHAQTHRRGGGEWQPTFLQIENVMCKAKVARLWGSRSAE